MVCKDPKRVTTFNYYALLRLGMCYRISHAIVDCRSMVFSDAFILKCCKIFIFHPFNCVHRGYYVAARGYEFYLRVLKVSLTSERSQ